jgi:DNA-binding NtrC family response regulator
MEFELPSKVLLVDDEREFVQTLSERLQMRDLPTAVVYDGEQALSYLNEEEPEVMILDLRMPGIDGVEVLRRVKKEHPAVEVIILTGHGTEKDAILTSELGAFAYLEKPVEIDKLAQTVKAAYEKIRKEKVAKKLGND